MKKQELHPGSVSKKRFSLPKWNINRDRQIFLLVLGFFIIVTSVYFIASKVNTKAEASWWNGGWQYRQEVRVSGATTLTNYQVPIVLDTQTLITAGKLQSNCNDLRITDYSGKTLSHWIPSSPNTSACNQTTTKIWVKIPTITTDNQVLYIYYGNTTATNTRDGSQVFLFFDEFNTLQSSWNQDSGIWIQETFDSKSTISTEPTSSARYFFRNTSYSTPASFTIESSLYSIQAGDSSAHPGIMFYANNSHNDNFYFRPHAQGSNNIQYATWNGSTLGMVSSVAGTYTWNSWMNISVKVNGDSAEIFQDGVSKNTRTGLSYDGVYSQMGLVAYDYGKNYFDYLAIRQYTTTEPTVGSVTNEQQAPGPIAYWKLDEGSGQTINSTNNNQGTLGVNSGSSTDDPTWKSESECLSGKCLYFDGTSDYLLVNPASLGLDQAFTVSVWLKPSLISGDNRQWIATTNDTIMSYFDTSTSSLFFRTNTGGIDTQDTTYDGVLNQWQHVVLVYDGTNKQTYVNGKLISNLNDTGTLAAITWLSLGADYGGGTPSDWYKGYMDEIKIYPYARSAAQILADYSGIGSVKGVSANIGTNNEYSPALNNGLVGYWNMDETSGSLADSSGNSNTGTWNGTGGTAHYATGKFGKGGGFNGTDDYVTATSIGAISTTGTYTFSAWIKPDSVGYTGNCGTSIFQNSTANNNRNGLCISNSTVNFGYYNGSWVSKSGPITSGQWHHIVGISQSGNLSLYINNELQTTAGAAYSAHFSSAAPTTLFMGRTTASDPTPYFDGTMDEVRVYNRALTAAEISTLYNWAPSPIAYWNFDEGSGQYANDTSGNNNTGTLGTDATVYATDPTWSSGKIGKGMSFNGTNYINVAAPTNLGFSGDQAYTMSAWVKPAATRHDGSFVSYGNGGAAGKVVSLNSTYNNQIYSVHYGNDRAFTTTWQLGVWQHVALAYDPTTSTEKLYVNGIYKEQWSPNNLNLGSGEKVHIGRATWNGTYANTTQIDQVKIYNYARTAAQLSYDFNQGQPIGWWKFDEGTNNTCSGGTNDTCNSGSGGSLLDGAETNTSWSNEGRFGKALGFYGTNSTVVITDTNGLLQIDGDITISSWVKTTKTDYQIVIDDLGASPFTSWSQWLDPNGKVIWYDGGTWRVSQKSVNDGQWHHIVTVVSNNNLSYYIDGVLDANTYSNVSARTKTADAKRIGTRADGLTYPFSGLIDEVKVYNFALTQTEVKLEYGRGKTTIMGALSDTSQLSGGSVASNSASAEYCVPGSTDSCAGPVGEWKLDEKNGSTAYDNSGNNNTGTIYNSPTWSSSGACKQGGCLKYTASNQYTYMAENGSLDISGPVTLEAWVWWNQHKDYGVIANKGSGGGSASFNYGFWSYSSQLRFFIGNGTASTGIGLSSSAISTGAWHHIVAVADGSYMYLYLDGRQVAKASQSITPAPNDTLFRLGENGRMLDGKIDTVRVYNYARTAAQIAWDYNRGEPIAHWRFDECQGTTINDSSGNGNNGTLTVGATLPQTSAGTCSSGTATEAWNNGTSGKYSSSLNFDGVDDYILGSNETNFDFERTQPFSACSWINPTNVSDLSHTIISKLNQTSNVTGWEFTLYDGGTASDGLTVYLINNFGGNNYIYKTTNGNILASTWQHVCFTYDGSSSANGINIYKNGFVQTASSSGGTLSSSILNNVNIELGKRPNYNGLWYKGQLDDMKVFNYALTKQQIRTLYNESSAIRFGP